MTTAPAARRPARGADAERSAPGATSRAPGAVWRETLRSGALQLGLDLPESQVDALLQYLGLFERWGRVHNLSAVDRPDDAVVLHLLDSLSIVPLLDRHRPQGGVLLDVGSGAGLPGVVVAVVRPRWRVITVDAVAKKSAFVAQVAIELGLRGLEALHARAESLGDESARPTLASRRWHAAAPAGADVVVSRAFASLTDFTRLTERALAPDGVWLAMKGKVPEDEIGAIADAAHAADGGLTVAEVFHVEPLRVPGLDAERCAVWLRRRAAGATG